MTTFATIIGDGTTILSTDDAPDVTAPDPSRIFTAPAGDSPCYITTLGASDNVLGDDYALCTIWGRDAAFGQWFWVLDVPAISQVQLGYANAYVVPRNMDFFVQITTNSGVSGLTKIGIGYVCDVP